MSKRVIGDDMGPSVDRRAFREQLLNRMQLQKMTGAQLARSARISRDAVSSYTSMRSLPTPETLEKLAKVLKCKPTDLLREVNGDSANHLMEMREYVKPGYKLLVIRVPLPTDIAIEICGRVAPYFAKAAKRDA